MSETSPQAKIEGEAASKITTSNIATEVKGSNTDNPPEQHVKQQDEKSAGVDEKSKVFRFDTAKGAFKQRVQQASSDPESQYAVGMKFFQGKEEGIKQDYQQALVWWTKAANQGHPGALTNIGVMHFRGLGVPKDEKTAAGYYQKAAKQNDAGALCNLGFMYKNGLGDLGKDEKKAVEMFSKAADKGHAGAQCNLGVMYFNGLGGLEKNEKKALELYVKAAASEHAGAQCNLAGMHLKGLGGLEADERKAMEYYSLAASQGHRTAQAHLRKIIENSAARSKKRFKR
ncbi:hypothetical protein AAMO2058_000117300 [Amorphochlora amoebiformis]